MNYRVKFASLLLYL